MRTGTVSYKLEDLKKGVIIPIGFVGENDFTRVIFDAEEIYKKYPSASVSMKVQPPKGGIYPATVTRDGNTVIWQVKEADVANRGGGELQLTFTDGETKIKTYIAKTDVKRSLAGNGPAPDPVQDWIDDAEDVLEEVEAAEIHQPIIGLDGYWYTWNQETGEYEKTNTKAQGAEGHSPVLTSSKSGKTTTLYADGEQIAQILDGEDGQGADVIDDTAGEGDTDKTWSADKLTDEFGDVLNAIEGKPDEKGSNATGVDLDVADNEGNVVLRLKNGHIQTKKFNSETDAPTESHGSSETVDLDITDTEGNVILRLSEGGIETKKFKSGRARQLDGIKWACMGDSLTEHNDKATKNYHDYVHDDTGIFVYNMGHSGCGYAKVGSYGKNFVGIAEEIPEDADIITIFGSGNDANMEMDIGTKTDTGSTTLCGFINQTLDIITTNFPLVPLGIITPTPWTNSEPSAGDGRMKQYSNALKEICEWRGIPCLNLYYCSNLHPGNATFRTLAYSHDGGAGVHPDENGHKIIAPRFREFIFSLI